MFPLRILYQFPDWAQRFYPHAVWRGDKGGDTPTVYLTFDDGPVPEATPQVLDILDTYGVKATFFWVGENLIKYPHLAQEVVSRGHRVGNHTYNHLSGWSVSADEYKVNVQKADAIMHEVIPSLADDKQAQRLFRPPYGKMRREVYKWLQREGYTIVLWDIVTHDYNRRYTPQEIEKITLRYVRDGSILLLHDSIKASKNTLTVLPTLIHRLQVEGYEFRTL